MNRTKIRSFAVWARNKLISDIKYRASLMGITEEGISKALPQSTYEMEFYDTGTEEPYIVSGEAIKQRRSLVKLLKNRAEESNYKTAYKYVCEEVAYTWFNRLIAVRFMEVNDYLPSHIRVLSSDSGKIEPDLVTTPFDAELSFTENEKAQLVQMKQDNRLDDAFRMLFIKQCNSLNTLLPALFEKTNDYTELLLSISVIDKEGIVYHLVNDIPEDDFNVEKGGQVEIIGWLYQYYNTEPKNQIINVLKGAAVNKEDIPAATQLFTTDWVVRYIVDNTIGRYWIERHPESHLIEKLPYFVRPQNGKIKYSKGDVKPEEMTVLDNCMGSGHFLVYAIEVLMMIYKENGYDERSAIQVILERNIAGLDIDRRAYQMGYFAIMMKARQYDRRILTRGIVPKVYEIMESNQNLETSYDWLPDDLKQVANYLKNIFKYAKEYGSIIKVEEKNYNALVLACEYWIKTHEITLESYTVEMDVNMLIMLAKQAMIMSKKYTAVVTNPPYLGRFDNILKEYINSHYKEYSGDLFSVFMVRNFDNCIRGGYTGFMTPYVWMFIKTYEKLRDKIVNDKTIVSLIQMEYSAFEEATVPICTFVLKNNNDKDIGYYIRLSDFRGGMEIQGKKVKEAILNPSVNYFYESDAENFKMIPGTPIAYWVTPKVFGAFSGRIVKDYGDPRKGLVTLDNNRFLRLWNEVKWETLGIDTNREQAILTSSKWIPIHKGGEFRKWYGNNDYVVNWFDDGKEIKDNIVRQYKGGSYTKEVRSEDRYFMEGITWTVVSSSKTSFRRYKGGFIFSNSGESITSIDNPDKLDYMIALLNSKFTEEILKIIAPTLGFESGYIGQIPMIVDTNYYKRINALSNECVDISKKDWDSFESSWDFKRHPLV